LRRVIKQKGAIGQINGDSSQRIIHGGNGMAVTPYSFALAESFGQCLSKYQPYIFHRMVKIDV
jgi:hypothetical protein